MPVSQYEIYTDTSTYIVCNLILNLECDIKCFLHPHSGKHPVQNLSETQMLFQTEFGVLYLCSLSNLYTLFTYATVCFFFLTKLEISGHGRSNYLLLFSSRMQENKNHLNKSYFM